MAQHNPLKELPGEGGVTSELAPPLTSLLEASKSTLDSVFNILNKLKLKTGMTGANAGKPAQPSEASHEAKGAPLRRLELETLKDLRLGLLKDIDVKVARLKTDVRQLKRLRKSAVAKPASASSLFSQQRLSAERDARLEVRLEAAAEEALATLIVRQDASCDSLLRNNSLVDLSVLSSSDGEIAYQWLCTDGVTDDRNVDVALEQACKGQQQLSLCFDEIFSQLCILPGLDVENALELWCMLNPTSELSSSFLVNGGILSASSLHRLLKLGACGSHLSVRTWCLLFQVLLSVCAHASVKAAQRHAHHSSASALLLHEGSLLADVIFKFLSQSSVNGVTNVGPYLLMNVQSFLAHLVGVPGRSMDAQPSANTLDQANFHKDAYLVLLQVAHRLLSDE